MPGQIGPAPQIKAVYVDEWWSIFDDPVLHKLIEKGLKSNLDIKEAYAKLKVQYALLKQARSPLFPLMSMDYSISRSRRPGFFGKDLGTDYRYGLNLSYELDVWKKIQSSVSASAFEANATKHDIKSLRIVVSTEIARDYYIVLELLKRLDILEKKRAALMKKKAFISFRYKYGTTQSDSIYLLEQQLKGLDAQVSSTRAELERTQNALQVLVGEYPRNDEWLSRPLYLNNIPVIPKTGIPISILLQRPDVKAAELRVKAQDERVAQAISEWFPSLGINLGYGRSRSASSFGIISGMFWTMAFNASAVIFEGGARKARIEQERAALIAALIRYHRSILRAFEEVKTAISVNEKNDERLRSLEYYLTSADALFNLESARFKKGISSGLEVLDRELVYLDSVMQYNQALRDCLLARVELVKALGGAWKPR